MKQLTLVAFLIYASNQVNAQSAKTVHAFNDHFTMTLPADVDTMSAAQVQQKYHKTKDPRTHYFASNDLSFSIVIAAIANGITEKDMIAHKDDITNKFVSQQIKVDTMEVKHVNGHDFLVLTFHTATPENKILNKRLFAVADGKLIMAAFNCTIEQVATRIKQMDESIQSVQIK